MALTIQQAEERHPDLIKGQYWQGNHSKYFYRCEIHGVYEQEFNSHGKISKTGHRRGCPVCGLLIPAKARRVQYPNTTFTFKCGHKAMLPDFCITTKKVTWNTHSKSWGCRSCYLKHNKNLRDGTGPLGLLGRMRYLYRTCVRESIKWGYTPPNITPELLVTHWVNQNGKCAWTGEKIELLGRGTAMEHNHKTGEFRGFVKADANHSEGYLGQLTFRGRVNLFAKLYEKEMRATLKIIENKS